MECFDRESIAEFFAVSDQAIADRDFVVYSSLFWPKYHSSGLGGVHWRTDYLDHAEELFKTASSIEVKTEILDIEFTKPESKARALVKEEESYTRLGESKRYTSLIEYEIGFEDGWMYLIRAHYKRVTER